MDPILDQALSDYLDGWLSDRPDVLRDMEAYAAEHAFPIVGPQAGLFLYQWASVMKPARMFEMGSGFGYSACWLLMGAPEAELVCTDTSADNAERARSWLTQAGLWDRVEFRIGDAVEVLRETAGPFDLIYNDVDKGAYPAVFKLAIEKLRPGGLLISDNVLWGGRVADPADQDPWTVAIREYNRLMFQTPDVQSVIVPIRDGLGVTLMGAG